MLLVCPASVKSSLPDGTVHNLTVRSSLPVASLFPSGEMARVTIASVCPLSVAISSREAMSHSLAVLSWLAEARILSSGLNATDVT